MILLGAIGAGMMLTSVVGMVANTPTAHIRRQLRKYMDANRIEGVHIKKITRKGMVFSIQLTLNYKLTTDSFSQHLPGIEQALASPVRLRQLQGALHNLDVSFNSLKEKMMYEPPNKPTGSLSIPLFTPFGGIGLNLADETSCHVLIGGATRMGKSVLIRLIATHLMLSTDGRVRIIIADNKITDLYMFRDVPQITCAETLEEAFDAVNEVHGMIKTRREILKAERDCVDLNDLRKKRPDLSIDPIFVIVDEYGRFADDDIFQAMVTSLAETAGYLDIHLIVASQRPDAKDVLKPRIKANMLTRICFRTTDETNSNIVLGSTDAAKLPVIRGRAVLMDGLPEVVQVPYLPAEYAQELLEPYRSVIEHDTKRYEDRSSTETLPGFVENAFGADGVPGRIPPLSDDKPSNEKTNKRRSRPRNPPTER